MKKLLFILIATVPVTVFAQCEDMSMQMKEATENCLGKTIGRGRCSELTDSVKTEIGANLYFEYTGWEFYYNYKKGVPQVKRKKYTKPKPGDILLWGGATEYHIAVISQVLSEGNYMIIHQNATGGPMLRTTATRDEWNYMDMDGGSVKVKRAMKGDCFGIRKRRMFHVK